MTDTALDTLLIAFRRTRRIYHETLTDVRRDMSAEEAKQSMLWAGYYVAEYLTRETRPAPTSEPPL